METYLKNPMQDITQIDDIDEMPKTNGMKPMYPMMEMEKMSQMMYIQSMYKMMHTMYGISQMINMKITYMMNMNMHMMDMQGMNDIYAKPPAMGMGEMHKVKPMYRQDDDRESNIPMLANLKQLSPTQIQISYDMDVDVRLGMRATNYWVKDTMNVRPTGIATLGKNDTVNARNSLTNSNVKIDQKNSSAKTFILTFNRAIPKGAEYMLIICYVTVKGAPPYFGDNGMATFLGM